MTPFPGLRPFILTLLAAALLLAVQPAQAHGYLIRALPEDRAVLARPPARVQYWFSEALEPRFSGLNVRDAGGAIIATGGIADDNPTLLRAALPPDLPDGAYIVELRPAFASDGHVVAESRVFFVGEEVGGVAGQAATDQAIPLEVVWRALTLIGALLAFGASILYSAVLLPAWGSRDFPAGWLPPRVMNRLGLIYGGGLALALASSALGLLQQATAFFNTGPSAVISGRLWEVVRIGSRFGDVWNFRVLLLLIAGALLIAARAYRASNPAVVRPTWTASAWALALVIGSFSVVSHAAGSTLWPWVGIVVDWLHGVAAGAWVGALAAFVLVVPAALAPLNAEARRLALLAALRRFAPLAAVCVALVTTTGLYSASNWIAQPSDVTETPFGLALAVKVAMVGGLIALGALNQIALNPARYARLAPLAARAGDFAARLRLETALGLMVLCAAGLVTATPPPVPADAADQPPAPTATLGVDGLEVVATLSPGGPGVNTLDVVLARDGARLNGARVWIQHIDPARDRRGDWEPADAAEAGLYVAAGDAIDVPGAWWTLIDIEAGDGKTTRAAIAWEVSAEATVLAARPPNALNIAALLGVVAALAGAAYAPARRLMTRFDLRPLTVLIALGAVGISFGFMLFGAALATDAERRYQETLNPPPDRVNPTLPDADSLARGAAIFAESCGGWAGAEALAALAERMTRLGDAELFALTFDGARGLPPCDDAAAPINAAARWDLVNYLRALERAAS